MGTITVILRHWKSKIVRSRIPESKSRAIDPIDNDNNGDNKIVELCNSNITIIINRFARICTPELIRLTWSNSISEHQSGSSVAHVFRTSWWWEMRDGFRWVPCVLPSPWSPGHQGAPLPAPTNPANGRPDRCRWFQLAAGPRGALTASETWWWTILFPTTSGPSTALHSDITGPLDTPLVGAGHARGERRQMHRGKQR